MELATPIDKQAPDSAEDPRLQGLIFLDEQSIIRDDCVRKRWAVLTDQYISFSKTESSKQKKLWSFHHRCTVHPDAAVQTRTCRILHSRYMVLSLSYKSSKQNMYCFKVSWPTRSSTSQTKRTRLFAFREEAEATKWHDAVCAAISAQALPDTPSLAETPAIPATPTGDLLQYAGTTHGGTRHTRTSSMPSPLASGGASVNFRGFDDTSSTPRQPDDSDVAYIGALGAPKNAAAHLQNGIHGAQLRGNHGMRTSHDRPVAASLRTLNSGISLDTEFATTDGYSGGAAAVVPENSDAPAHYELMKRANSSESFVVAKPENVTKLDVRPNLRAWGRFHLINGLSIWKERSGHSSASTCPIDGNSRGLDSYMVSKRIRGTPGQVVKSLLRLDGRGSCFWAFDTVSEVLSMGSTDQAVLFKATMAPPNALQAAFSSHRDFFLQRSCRKEDDESYVVLLHSIDRNMRDKHNYKVTPGHVEGHIASMGFTVAPLKPAYRMKMGERLLDSHECLVTLVLSADMGGWLGADSSFKYCCPFFGDLEIEWLQRLLMTLVALGNKVDQDCFVKGCEDMVDSSFKTAHEQFLPAVESPMWSTDNRADESSTKAPDTPQADVAEGSDAKTGDASSGVASSATPAETTKVPAATLGSSPAPPSMRSMLKPAGLDPRYFSDPGANNFKIRGKNYLVDKKKIPTEEPLFRLVAVDLVKTDAPIYHISRYLPVVRQSTAPFSFVLSFTLPHGGRILGLVLIFEADEAYGGVGQNKGGSSDEDSEEDEGQLAPYDLCLARFLADKGPLRDAKLKLIPSLAQGAWWIRQAVGQTPVMLGKRLKTQYFMENAYVEADVDISANATAAGVTSMVAGSIKSLVFDIGILLEGHSEDELPERLLGAVRLNHLDLKAARELDTSKEIPAGKRPVPKGFFEDSQKRNLSVSVPASTGGSAPPSASVTPTPSNPGTLKVH